MENKDLIKAILYKLACLSVNYGLRARLRDVIDLGQDPLSVEICEAREAGASEAYMKVLEICAVHDEDAARDLQWIRSGDEDEKP